MIKLEGRKEVYKRNIRMPKTGSFYANQIAITHADFINRVYRGWISFVDMDLPEPVSWIAETAGKGEKSTDYIFEIKSRKEREIEKFRLHMNGELDQIGKECILEHMLKYDPSIRGSRLKQTA